MALGVHLANHRRGSLVFDFLTGAAIWAAGAGIGFAVANAMDSDAALWTAFVAIPIAQIASTVAVERATGRSRERHRGAALSILPVRGGRLAFAVSFPLPRP